MCEESITVFRELGDMHAAAHPLASLVALSVLTSNWGAARARLTEVLALIAEHDVQSIGEQVLHHAALLSCKTATGTIASSVLLPAQARAVMLEGAAERLREALSTPIIPAEREVHATFVAALRAGLGNEAFTSAWEKGRAMAFDEVIAWTREWIEHLNAAEAESERTDAHAHAVSP